MLLPLAAFGHGVVPVFGQDDAHVRGDGLDDDGGDALAVLGEYSFKLVRVVVGAGQRSLRRAARDAGAVGLARGREAGAGLDEHRVRMSVVAALEFHDKLAPREAARDAQRREHGLRARRNHAHHLDAGDERADELRHLDLGLGRQAVARAELRGLLHGFDDGLVGVSENHRPPRAYIVRVSFSVFIPEVLPFGAGGEYRRAADAPEGADGAVDAAGDQPLGAREEFCVAVH